MSEEKKVTPTKEVAGGTVVAEDKENGILYVQHPVTAAQKKDLVKKGKIIDARFKP